MLLPLPVVSDPNGFDPYTGTTVVGLPGHFSEMYNATDAVPLEAVQYHMADLGEDRAGYVVDPSIGLLVGQLAG